MTQRRMSDAKIDSDNGNAKRIPADLSARLRLAQLRKRSL